MYRAKALDHDAGDVVALRDFREERSASFAGLSLEGDAGHPYRRHCAGHRGAGRARGGRGYRNRLSLACGLLPGRLAIRAALSTSGMRNLYLAPTPGSVAQILRGTHLVTSVW